jgi:hypothetical protein
LEKRIEDENLAKKQKSETILALLLSHPLSSRPHDGEDDDEYDEDAHQQDRVGGAGDGFTLLKQARQGESAFRNSEQAECQNGGEWGWHYYVRGRVYHPFGSDFNPVNLDKNHYNLFD